VAQNNSGQTSRQTIESQAWVQDELQSLATRLNLTDKQKTQINPILEDEYWQLMALDNDPSLDEGAKENNKILIRNRATARIRRFQALNAELHLVIAIPTSPEEIAVRDAIAGIATCMTPGELLPKCVSRPRERP